MTEEHSERGYEKRISHSEECCEGYRAGRFYGDREARSGSPIPEPNDRTSSYQLGFTRGVADAQRWSRGQSSVEKQLREEVYLRIESLSHVHYKHLTDEEAKEWRSLQAAAVAFGEKSWEDILLDLHYQLALYEDLASSATYEEKEAIRITQRGVVNRLAKTSVANS